MHCRPSIPALPKAGLGSRCFREKEHPIVLLAAFTVGTICIHKLSDETSSGHLKVLQFTNLPHRTPCVTASQRTYRNLALMLELFKPCWVTTT